ncbi:hypothetical protein Lser_V15G42014 [Lactuca serriola]
MLQRTGEGILYEQYSREHINRASQGIISMAVGKQKFRFVHFAKRSITLHYIGSHLNRFSQNVYGGFSANSYVFKRVFRGYATKLFMKMHCILISYNHIQLTQHKPLQAIIRRGE